MALTGGLFFTILGTERDFFLDHIGKLLDHIGKLMNVTCFRSHLVVLQGCVLLLYNVEKIP